MEKENREVKTETENCSSAKYLMNVKRNNIRCNTKDFMEPKSVNIFQRIKNHLNQKNNEHTYNQETRISDIFPSQIINVSRFSSLFH